MRYLIQSLFFTILFNACLPGQGVESAAISGRVIDKKSAEPLVSVNVFLNNTTIGASTGPDGYFSLPSVPQGVYELIVSIVGYEHEEKIVRISAGKEQRLFFQLNPRVYKVNSVDVAGSKAEHRKWQRQYERFKREFLGTTFNASQCHIINPEVLDFEDRDGALTATASEPLSVMNYALGYNANVILLIFSRSDVGFLCRFKVQFVELVSEKRTESWEENRLKAFNGSFRHFILALINGDIKDEGFYLSTTKGIDSRFSRFPYSNPNWQQKLFTYNEERSECKLHFANHLEVQYINEKDELTNKNSQLSFIDLQGDSVSVDLAGNSSQTITYYGRWGKERFAEVLPLNYEPPAHLKVENMKREENL